MANLRDTVAELADQVDSHQLSSLGYLAAMFATFSTFG